MGPLMGSLEEDAFQAEISTCRILTWAIESPCLDHGLCRLPPLQTQSYQVGAKQTLGGALSVPHVLYTSSALASFATCAEVVRNLPKEPKSHSISSEKKHQSLLQYLWLGPKESPHFYWPDGV